MKAGGIPSSSPAPSWVTSDASPWTSVGARTIEAPNAAAIDCIPRQTPRRGNPRSAATLTAPTEIPASSGSPGPGEITIRSAVLKHGQAHVHTGAGIVAASVPEREFEETEHKAAALRRAIEMAAGVSEAPGAEASADLEADEIEVGP